MSFKIGKSLSYTPELVQLLLTLYQHPDHPFLEYGDRSPKDREMIDLLQRAGIVHALSPRRWEVDRDALHVYVNAVCNVPLPRKVWVT